MKSRSSELLDYVIAAIVVAKENETKPEIPYWSEDFCILAFYGWELLFKTKWLKESGNRIQTLH